MSCGVCNFRQHICSSTEMLCLHCPCEKPLVSYTSQSPSPSQPNTQSLHMFPSALFTDSSIVLNLHNTVTNSCWVSFHIIYYTLCHSTCMLMVQSISDALSACFLNNLTISLPICQGRVVCDDFSLLICCCVLDTAAVSTTNVCGLYIMDLDC